jgi:hypothetical protein
MVENRQTQTPDQHGGHGSSIAAWTAVGVIMVGFLVMSIAVLVRSVALFAVGVVVLVLGGLAGKVLAAMGFGVSGKPGS